MRRVYDPARDKRDVREEYDAQGRVTARIVESDERHPQSVRITYDATGRITSHIVACDERHPLSYRREVPPAD
jgi:YD repeat-containing protein